jgi:hypothetical protein
VKRSEKKKAATEGWYFLLEQAEKCEARHPSPENSVLGVFIMTKNEDP